jgi:membrane protein DedA with SNARE-associated domain
MDPSQIASQILEAVSQLSGLAAYATIIGILVICGLGIPIPEDITLLVAGLLAASGTITLPGALMAGFAGVLLGDAFLFFMGRRYGKKIFGLPGLRRVFTEERVLMAEQKIRRNGPFICFVARFLPGLRSPIFAMSGALGVRPIVFFSLDGFAAMISVPVWVYLGYWAGNLDLEDALAMAEKFQGYVIGGLAVLILAYVAYKYLRKKARRKANAAPQLPQE